MIEIIVYSLLWYAIGCAILSQSELYRLDSVPLFSWIENMPNWMATKMVILFWPYVAFHLATR